MGVLLVLLGLGVAAIAAPVTAQDYRGLPLQQEAGRVADAQAARSRDIALTNELSALQARVQGDQALGDVAALRVSPAVPVIPLGPYTPPPKIDVSKLATIPDTTLAQSNARVRAAADNRR
ncbi:hypothetical protein [Phenylobacterium sp.]|uniref:hypothetical protein n=1 Tax=Phenylobacterium sp. TaxID=1871053 RepID=UPI0035635C3B